MTDHPGDLRASAAERAEKDLVSATGKDIAEELLAQHQEVDSAVLTREVLQENTALSSVEDRAVDVEASAVAEASEEVHPEARRLPLNDLSLGNCIFAEPCFALHLSSQFCLPEIFLARQRQTRVLDRRWRSRVTALVSYIDQMRQLLPVH